jgi:predicted metal-dependent phosphoesterase TrpH
MIDLHLHTTASDGRCTPRELIALASRVGLTIIAITDHDTVAGCSETHASADERGILAISGIEITAIEGDRDVHVLGYFVDPEDAVLTPFLIRQRAMRVARVEAVAARLASLGMPIDVESVMRPAKEHSHHSIGRPQLARAMVEAGHVADTREAFDRWLGRGCPAFIPRGGPSAESVIEIIHGAGGIASLAHPGTSGLESSVQRLAAAGLDAVEAFHPDHDASTVARYVDLARRFDLLLTGGSDFHGDAAHGAQLGAVTLPAEEFERLCAARPDASR